jgi:hypothetical protein
LKTSNPWIKVPQRKQMLAKAACHPRTESHPSATLARLQFIDRKCGRTGEITQESLVPRPSKFTDPVVLSTGCWRAKPMLISMRARCVFVLTSTRFRPWTRPRRKIPRTKQCIHRPCPLFHHQQDHRYSCCASSIIMAVPCRTPVAVAWAKLTVKWTPMWPSTSS